MPKSSRTVLPPAMFSWTTLFEASADHRLTEGIFLCGTRCILWYSLVMDGIPFDGPSQR